MELKNKMKYSFMFLILILTLVGCSKSNSDTYAKIDLYSNSIITLERSEMYTMQEYAIQKITIDKNGLLYETFYPNQTLSHSTYTKFEKGEYEELILVLKENKFENLRNKYESDVMIADIGKGVITISNKQNSHSIEINPYTSNGNIREISKIMAKIDELISNAKSPFQTNIKLKYSGVQCQEELWYKWYKEGNIRYVMAPTEKQLIGDYYSNKEIDIISIEEKSNGMVCQGCDICPKDKYYIIEINNYDQEYLIEDGWKEFEE